MDLNTKIAGENTKADWLNLRVHLRENLESTKYEYWLDAFDKYFRKRLNTKFLDSIANIIQKNEIQKIEYLKNKSNNKKKLYYLGEGFSIVIIECVVLEILASFRRGQTSNLHFRLNDNDVKFYRSNIINYEQRLEQDSRELIINFLQKQKPFSNYFALPIDKNNPPRTLADSFYSNYRNYLIHNGDTNNNCKIRVINNNDNRIIIHYYENKNGNYETVLYRNALYFGITKYISEYRDEIIKNANKELRLNFLLKMDDLCQTDNDN